MAMGTFLFSLAVNEVGVIHVNSALFKKTVVDQYPSVAQISLKSSAQVGNRVK